MSDIWGFCPRCDRWFACDSWHDRSRPEPACPTCSGPATAIENRTRPAGGSHVRLLPRPVEAAEDAVEQSA